MTPKRSRMYSGSYAGWKKNMMPRISWVGFTLTEPNVVFNNGGLLCILADEINTRLENELMCTGKVLTMRKVGSLTQEFARKIMLGWNEIQFISNQQWS